MGSVQQAGHSPDAIHPQTRLVSLNGCSGVSQQGSYLMSISSM